MKSPLSSFVALSICFLAAATSFAQQIPYTITYELRTGDETKRFSFTYAAHTEGTDDVDTALGEVEIPNIPLPGDIFYVWTVAPLTEPIWLSPLDVRKYEIGAATRVDFDTRVNWSGGTLELFWTKPLPAEIDSIWITDGFSDFPDNFVSQKVVPGERLTTTNPAITRFKVLIWYNGIATSVAHEADLRANDLSVYPNPAEHELHVGRFMEGAKEIRIVNMFGQLVSSLTVNADPVHFDISNLAVGQYIIMVTLGDGTVSSHPFIKR